MIKKFLFISSVAIMASFPICDTVNANSVGIRNYPGNQSNSTCETKTVGTVYAKGFLVNSIKKIDERLLKVELIDRGGQVWFWCSNSVDLEEMELVSVLMDDMGTPEIDDDMVISEPHFDGWWLEETLDNYFQW